MTKLTVENVYIRQEAKQLTNKYLWKLIGMLAIAFVIPYALLMLGSTLLATASADSPIFAVGTLVLIVVFTLIMCGLMMGLLSAMIDLARHDQTVTVGRVFSRTGQCLKAFGLTLWVGLKTILWMLPGYAVVIVGAVLSLGSVDASAGSISENAALVAGLATIGGVILIFALVIPAAYRYMMSTYILADKPETGVFDCVKQSKAMMKGHKWQAFKLVVPIILVMYVLMMVIVFASNILLPALGQNTAAVALIGIVILVAYIALVLYFSIRMYMCYVLFYLRHSQGPAPAEAFPDVVESAEQTNSESAE